jgi:hypothetical protein
MADERRSPMINLNKPPVAASEFLHPRSLRAI